MGLRARSWAGLGDGRPELLELLVRMVGVNLVGQSLAGNIPTSQLAFWSGLAGESCLDSAFTIHREGATDDSSLFLHFEEATQPFFVYHRQYYHKFDEKLPRDELVICGVT